MDVYYLPDTHIFFPKLFLSDVDVSSVPNYKVYRECFQILLNYHCSSDMGKIVLFPAINEDFTRLLVSPYHNFLLLVMNQARKATSIEDLRNRVVSMIKYDPQKDKFLGYWKLRWEKYNGWIPFNQEKIDSFITQRIIEVLTLFGDYYSTQKMRFSLDTDKVEVKHDLLLSHRKSGILPKEVGYNDLKILASCLVFTEELSPEGILYLITDDEPLKKSAKTEIEQLGKMYPDEDLTRFKVLDPKEICH